MKKILLFGLTVFCCSLISNSSFAQTGKITGRIVDGTTSEALPFVNVLIVGTSEGAATDIDGYFTMIGVRPGVYSLKASAIGYTPVVIEKVQVSIDLTSEVNFEMYETSIELKEEVVVTATKPLVTKDLTSSTAIVSSDEIRVLPVTEFQQVLQLKAGIVGKDNNVRGGRKGEVVFAIDGVPVTDVYDGSTVVDVNVNSIQELQFVSGAFNAEYGKALSGYVNIATKEGTNKFSGVITSYIGDYVSTGTDIFRGIDRVDPVSIRNFEANLSGPIIPSVLSFYANGRYIYFGGWMNGQDNYKPWNITINHGPDSTIEHRYTLSLQDSTKGSGDYVPMNWNEKFYGQAKLTLNAFYGVKVNFNWLYDDVEYRDYDHSFSYNPYGDYKRYRTGITNILSIIHTLSPTTFYQMNFSYFFKRYRQFVYEDPNDARWTNDVLLGQQPAEVPSFKTGGTQNSQFKRITNSYGLKIDFTSQLDKINLVKFGVEFNRHQLTFNNITLLQDPAVGDPRITGNPFVKRFVPDINDPNENLSIDKYIRKPIELSGYIQDKIELDNMIINAGVRVDYFKSDGYLLNDPTDPDIYRPRRIENIYVGDTNNDGKLGSGDQEKTINQRKKSNANGKPWYRDPEASLQFSPRLGIAFPITDRGVVHFSYGHFFQIPSFELLYTNPEYKFGAGSGTGSGTGNLGIAGNPELKPQQTISGEVGFQQAFSDDISIDVTMYFRDIRNLAGTRADEIRMFGGTATYSQYTNSDFGSVIGVVFTLTKRLSNNWAATIDYTFQKAKGNASDPAATRNAISGGQQPEVQLVRLNWDQTHTLNFTFSYDTPDLWGFAFIGRYGSGFPYTPSYSLNVSSLLTNTGLKPATFNVDLRAYKDFMIADYRLSFFLRVNNVFDIRNQDKVYDDSGTADFTIQEFLRRNSTPLVNTVDQYYRDPTYYSEPRRVEFGASFYF